MHARKPRLALLTLLAQLVLLAPFQEGVAQEDVPEAIDFEELAKDRRQKAGRYPVSARISRYLSAAAEAVDDGDPQEANRLLLKLRENRLNPYEQALVYRMLAFVAYGADEPEDAIKYFKKFLDQIFQQEELFMIKQKLKEDMQQEEGRLLCVVRQR